MAKTRKYFTINPTLQPGQTIPYPLAGNYLTCLEATAGFRVAFDGEDFAEFAAGFTAEIEGGFTQVWVENTSGSANTLKLAIGNGRFNDGRLTASGLLNVADPGAGQESFSDLIAAVNGLTAAHREDQQLRARLTTLTNASYSEAISSTTVTAVTSAENANGILVRFAQIAQGAGGTPRLTEITVGGQKLLRINAAAGHSVDRVSNVLLPAGQDLVLTSGPYGSAHCWYEVL